MITPEEDHSSLAECAIWAETLHADHFLFVQDPRVHLLDKRVASDEVHLKGEDTEEKILIGALICHGSRSSHEAVVKTESNYFVKSKPRVGQYPGVP